MANRTASPGGTLGDPGPSGRRPVLRLGQPHRAAAHARPQRTSVRERFADPLARNGYALIANSGATGGLGLIYWLLMARLYPAADVVRGSAAYAAMNLLAGLTAQNFNGALTRFIPQAGGRTRTFIGAAYAVSALASLGLAALFVLTVRWWGSSYSELGGLRAGLAFAGCVVVWAVFTLQDSVLVGLRSAFWVFAENAIFGIVKIILLVLFVTALPGHLGIYASWMLPVILAVPLVNLLIFGRIVPHHVLETGGVPPPSNRQVGRFLAGDYFGALCLLAASNLVPVLVAARISAQLTAYFYMAWVIAGMVDMIGINMAMSLTVEGAFEAAKLAVNCRKALRKMASILLPSCVLAVLLAPWGLRLFGPAYAAHGARVLDLLVVATLPTAATELYLGVLRAQSRTSQVALIQAARCTAMLGLTVILTNAIGIVGVGVAAVSSQTVIAALISVGLWRVLVGNRGQKAAVRSGVRA